MFASKPIASVLNSTPIKRWIFYRSVEKVVPQWYNRNHYKLVLDGLIARVLAKASNISFNTGWENGALFWCRHITISLN